MFNFRGELGDFSLLAEVMGGGILGENVRAEGVNKRYRLPKLTKMGGVGMTKPKLVFKPKVEA